MKNALPWCQTVITHRVDDIRLITCGTVEEKIYRKQVFKGGLARSGTEDGIQMAYFSSQVHPLTYPVAARDWSQSTASSNQLTDNSMQTMIKCLSSLLQITCGKLLMSNESVL